jgi:hypothetical protein
MEVRRYQAVYKVTWNVSKDCTHYGRNLTGM